MVDFTITQWLCLAAIGLLALSHPKSPKLIGLLMGMTFVLGIYLG